MVALHCTGVYNTIDALRDNKPAALHQKLNGYRKKNKLDSALPDVVESWTN